jgi:hypothetical protein
VAENNTDQIGRLPKAPHPDLRRLQPLIGRWRIEGPDVQGEVVYGRSGAGSDMPHHSRSHLAGFPEPQDRARHGDTKHPIAGAQRNRAKGTLEKRHVHNHDLQCYGPAERGP